MPVTIVDRDIEELEKSDFLTSNKGGSQVKRLFNDQDTKKSLNI